MPITRTSLLKAGMVTSRPVITQHGVMLLPEGCELTETTITRLVNAKIKHVFVKRARGVEVHDEALRTIDERFAPVMHEPVMGRIYEITKEHLTGIYK